MAEKKKTKGLNAGDGSIVIGGNVRGSNIVIGDHNTVSNQSINIAPLFQNIYHYVDTHPKLQAGKKQDARDELKEIETALEEPKPDESFIARRFRNLKRMSPDIVEVAFETLKNPIGGVAEVIKRIAKKVAEEANA
jgi:Tat protein secretion system quality control protein TatD with DNase activity